VHSTNTMSDPAEGDDAGGIHTDYGPPYAGPRRHLNVTLAIVPSQEAFVGSRTVPNQLELSPTTLDPQPKIPCCTRQIDGLLG